jgi:hypothetical protein
LVIGCVSHNDTIGYVWTGAAAQIYSATVAIVARTNDLIVYNNAMGYGWRAPAAVNPGTVVGGPTISDGESG